MMCLLFSLSVSPSISFSIQFNSIQFRFQFHCAPQNISPNIFLLSLKQMGTLNPIKQLPRWCAILWFLLSSKNPNSIYRDIIFFPRSLIDFYTFFIYLFFCCLQTNNCLSYFIVNSYVIIIIILQIRSLQCV